jgi:glutamine amidotransferase
MIALIDYNAGNTASVANALDVLGKKFVLTKSENEICNADKIIFPGVGEASFAVKQLHKNNLINLLRIVKKPLLGICLGMQLLYEFSEEGSIPCLGILPGTVKRFDSSRITVPHMGWSEIFFTKESKLFNGIKEKEFFYFANSYYVPVDDNTTSIANHDVDFAASIEKDNIYGVQFHPEKSGEAGLKVLKNFVEL